MVKRCFVFRNEVFWLWRRQCCLLTFEEEEITKRRHLSLRARYTDVCFGLELSHSSSEPDMHHEDCVGVSDLNDFSRRESECFLCVFWRSNAADVCMCSRKQCAWLLYVVACLMFEERNAGRKTSCKLGSWFLESADVTVIPFERIRESGFHAHRLSSKRSGYYEATQMRYGSQTGMLDFGKRGSHSRPFRKDLRNWFSCACMCTKAIWFCWVT